MTRGVVFSMVCLKAYSLTRYVAKITIAIVIMPNNITRILTLKVLATTTVLLFCQNLSWTVTLQWSHRGGSRGRVQGVRTPPPPWDDLQFSNTTGILPKKKLWFIGVEVEQETSAPPPKKILDPPLSRYFENSLSAQYNKTENKMSISYCIVW